MVGCRWAARPTHVADGDSGVRMPVVVTWREEQNEELARGTTGPPRPATPPTPPLPPVPPTPPRTPISAGPAGARRAGPRHHRPAEASHAADTALTTSATDTPQNAHPTRMEGWESGYAVLDRNTVFPLIGAPFVQVR